MINNEKVSEYANLAASAYNNFSSLNYNKNDDIVIEGKTYKYIYATPHTTANGFQGVIYGVGKPDEKSM